MDYRTGFCFFAKDLFKTFNATALKIKKAICQDTYNCVDKRAMCARVFIYCCKLIILDIIENNITFVLPLLNNQNAFIYSRPIIGEELKLARQRGALKNIDLLATNFVGYKMVYEWDNKSGKKYKDIHIGGELQDYYLEQINSGKVYY